MTADVSRDLRGWHRGPLAALDFETTCVRPEEARIVGAAFVRAQHGPDVETREWIVDPGVPIEPEATEVHGYTDDYVRAHGVRPSIAVPEIAAQLYAAWGRGEPVIIYNASFDLTVLDRELRRYHGPGLDVRGLVVDPFVLDRLVDPYRRGSRKLIAVAEHYGADVLSPLEHHNAGRDALAAMRTAWKIANRYPQIRFAQPAELMTTQAETRRLQTLSLKAWFTGQGRHEEAASCRPEWPVWPLSLDAAEPTEAEAATCIECGAAQFEHGPNGCPATALLTPDWTT